MQREKNFPLLRPSLDDPKEGGEIFNPLFIGERERLRNFVDLVLKRKGLAGRKVIAKALREIVGAKGATQKIYDELNASLDEAHQFIRWISQTYLPFRFLGVINSDGLTCEEDDFLTLLRKYRDFIKGDDRLSKIREFETRRAILLTLILFDLKIHRGKLQLSGASVQAVTSYLERKFFTPGRIERKKVISYHDPVDFFRTSFWRFEGEGQDVVGKDGLKVCETELDCREFFWDRESHLVYYASRDKTRFSHLLKMLRKDIRDPYSSALDWRGFKVVFFSHEAFEAGLEKLRREVFYFPGVTWKLEDGRFFREDRNPFTSRNFRAKKFITVYQGLPCEVIVESIENHLNGFWSLGDENHELYRVRQLISVAFPLIFPEEIYQINWSERSIQEEISETVKGGFK
jgi:hypothetical protein